jgi:D-cysteine desulfhydrase family pyridoxal phosphate-dependent enzyme
MTARTLTAPLTPTDIRTAIASVPRVPLAALPTPLQELPRLGQELGIGSLYVKRDDLTGLAFGGNKVRNLEFRMAEAVAQGANVMIAGLEAQSNSARQTTAAANILGMRSILVLHTDRDWDWQGNLLVDRILGADVRFVESDDPAEMDRVLRAVAEEERQKGNRPYVMNHAGAFAVGSALAYVLSTLEIVEQLGALSKSPTHLYMTSGNKGHAGIVLGAKLLGLNTRTIAISQRRGDDRVSGALKGARDALDWLKVSLPLSESDIESYDDYVGPGYGQPSEGSLAAIKLAARLEGLILDPVYTGKAMAGLIDHARRGLVGKDDTVVFIHTGGLPALFAFKDDLLRDDSAR